MQEEVPSVYKDPLFLLFCDESEEFQVALRYAAKQARAMGAKLALLYNLEKQDFQHWGDIEKRMREEQRSTAEQFLYDAARTINDVSGLYPVYYMEEGSPIDTVQEVLKKDPAITRLILGASTQGSPGPLVSYFSTKGLANLHVPLVIIPATIESQDIDRIIVEV